MLRRIFFGLVVFALACSVEPVGPGVPDPIISGPVTQVLLETPDNDTIVAVGDSVRVKVTLRDAQNHLLESRQVTFESSDVRVATVTATGYVRARETGKVTIFARADGKQGQLSLRALLPDPCSATRSTSPNCAGSEIYVMVLFNERALPIHSPWGIGDWDYDDDAGTWKLTGETLTLLADRTFSWTVTHTATSGNTIVWKNFGTYTRSSPSSVQLLQNGFTYSATITDNRLVIRFDNGGSYTFERR